MIIGTFSKGIYAIPNIARFFSNNAQVKLIPGSQKLDCTITWGNKAQKALKFGNVRDIPVIKIEDGFIRSLAPQQYPILSIIKDNTGMYYDSRYPSCLEKIIITSQLNYEQTTRVRNLISIIKENKLSKYNHAPIHDLDHRDYVLIIDQTYNDLSVVGSNANEKTFQLMLEAAIDENPNKQIIIKTHPQVISKTKRGYFKDIKNDKIMIYNQEINPWCLIDNATAIYTVSSQLGFEALMIGKKVRCFGMPFYAGWGLTVDEFKCDRRIKRSIEDVFFNSYIQYSTYLNPFTLDICEIEEILPIINNWKNINQKNRIISNCMHISKWKRKTIDRFIYCTKNKIRHTIRPPINAPNILTWASKVKDSDYNILNKNSTKIIRMEDGFIRSIGLGAYLNQPQSIVIDESGIYYDATKPSDLEHMLNTVYVKEENIIRAQNIINNLRQFDITKYNVKHRQVDFNLPVNQKIVLVVGQVEDDASIKLGSVDIKTNIDLIKTVRVLNSDAFIIYKPHPDVANNLRRGKINPDFASKYVDVISNTSITALIDLCDEIHTITSLSGFEALVRNKKVFCYGLPFYANWGLTIDRHKTTRRTKALCLEELVYISLILYPRYIDPVTNLWCDLEVIIDRFSTQKNQPVRYDMFKRLIAKIKHRLILK